MAEQMTGGCACGRVRYTAAISDDDAYLCHCRMCQRATGSVSIAFKNVKQADVEWEHEPDWYDSSPIAERPYCRECGTSLGFRFKDGQREHGPDGRVASTIRRGSSRSIISAPRACTAPGSTPRACPRKRTEDYQPLVDKWVEATGQFPGMSDVAAPLLDRVGRRRARLSRDWAQGRPVILLHGLFSDANMNWIKFGHAQRIAAEGFRVIMPDLRAHGQSGQPHGERALSEGHPRPRPARAGRASRARPSSTSADFRSARGRRSRAWARGFGRAARSSAARASRGLRNWKRRKTFFLEAIDLFDKVQRGDPHWLSIQFMKSQDVDRVAAAQLLESFEDTFMDWLQAFTMPTLVVCGSEDDDNGSAEELADGAAQRGVQRSAGHAHELGHQAGVRRGDRRFLNSSRKGAPEGAPRGEAKPSAQVARRSLRSALPTGDLPPGSCAEAGVPRRVSPSRLAVGRPSRSPSESRAAYCSVHSPIWSVRLLIWSLIWLRRDHRNTPAASGAGGRRRGGERALARRVHPRRCYTGCGLRGCCSGRVRLRSLAIDFSPREMISLSNRLNDLSARGVRARFGSAAARRGEQRRARSRVRRSPAGRAYVSALDARYSPGASTLSCSTTPSSTIIE